MIKIREVQTQSKNTRVVRARKENVDDFIAYQLEFVPNEHSLNAKKNISCKAILEPQQGSNLISYTFELERGLYDVYVSKIIGRDSSSVQLDEDSKEKYPDPIMVGDPYMIGIVLEKCESYGEIGTRVHIRSKDEDIKLQGDVLYYQINDDDIRHIKYHVPFHDDNDIQFFIKGIVPGDLDFNLTNPSYALKIKIVESDG